MNTTKWVEHNLLGTLDARKCMEIYGNAIYESLSTKDNVEYSCIVLHPSLDTPCIP